MISGRVLPREVAGLRSCRWWIPVLGLATAAMLGLRRGDVVIYAYPLAGSLIGWQCYRRDPATYVELAIALWFWTPLVRRVVDFQTGWHAISPVMLAPLLVTAFSLVEVARYARAFTRRRFLPYLLCLAALAYAYCIGIPQNGVKAATFDLLSWAAPVAFGFYVARAADATMRERIVRAFALYGALAGAYGIYQYFYLPRWDAFWMQNAPMASIGQPFPEMVRVFGPLNSPGPYAVFLMAALLVPIEGRWRWLTTALMLPGLLLSLVRTAWVGLLVGASLLFLKLSFRLRLVMLGAVVAVGLAAMPLLSSPAGDVVMKRVETMTHLGEDASYFARQSFYETFLPVALDSVAGAGLGATGLATKLNHNGALGRFGNFDSGLMTFLYGLGWPGTVLFAWGLGWLIVRAVRRSGADSFRRGGAAISLGFAVQLLGANVMTGTVGAVFWLFLSAAGTGRGDRGAAP